MVRAEVIAFEAGTAELALLGIGRLPVLYKHTHRTHFQAEAAELAEFGIDIHFSKDGCWCTDLQSRSRLCLHGVLEFASLMDSY
jgi:hypothetical protein